MTPEKEVNMRIEVLGMTFDALSSRFLTKNASFKKLDEFLTSKTKTGFHNKDLKNFGLVLKNNSKILTNAGSLLSDNHNLQSSLLFSTRWKGLNKTHSTLEAIDDKELKGSLLFLYEESLKFVVQNNGKIWWKINNGRKEIYDYPMRAVQEVIINALIHRDYSINGSQIQIDMYDDRMEIYSAGGIVDGVNLQEIDINSMWSKRRNPYIADVFSALNLIEKRGSGLKKIYDEYK